MVKYGRLFAAGVSALALGACADSNTTAPRGLVATGPRFVQLTAAQQLVVQGPSSSGAPATYPLYAGGGGSGPGTQVGTVSVYSSVTAGGLATITVTYNLTSGCLTETHLQVALSTGGVPQKNGNPTPGQFDLSHSLSCTTTDSYTTTIQLGATDNAVVIAAHAVVKGTSTLFAGGNFVSGPTAGAGILTGNVVNHRAGNVSGFSATNTALVAAWEPQTNTDPSYWDTVINADPSGNGAWLLNHGADWVWESFRTAHPVEGDVIQADMTLTVPVATTGTFRITCDNGYLLYLNGVPVSPLGDGTTSGTVTQLSNDFAAQIATNTDLTDHNVNAQGWQNVEAYNVSLNAGSNLFRLFAVNEHQDLDDSHRGFAGFGGIGIGAAGQDPHGTADLNPAGCIFGLAANPVTSGEETAWGAPPGFTGATTGDNYTGGNFGGKNWATYFVYQVR